MNLYRVELAHKLPATFYVAARDEAEAARCAEDQWLVWDHTTYEGAGKAISVELVASGNQYPPRGRAQRIGWFLISEASP